MSFNFIFQFLSINIMIWEKLFKISQMIKM